MRAIEDLAAIVHELPRPLGDWHAWTAEIAAVAADLEAALDAVSAEPAAAAELVEADAPVGAPAGGGAVAAASARLASLPRPDGRHPYLDLIAPALEAGELLYEVLARHPRAADRFARRLLRRAA